MSESAIKVEGLGKKYKIGQSRSGDLRETFGNLFRSKTSYQQINGSTNKQSDEFWALKDISFDIPRGEAVGIIGRNGAGKSTLLKILSRITEPTTGRIEINGRVSSLLEVGTGFHPELTGKENIYLNGTILGMKRKEVKMKFEEIVEFSGVKKFLDTQIKHYSSGMKVRLAFSVAAHLEPEILLIDEVLAVGDAEFQKKCLGKMEDITKGGRTVMFVSHNMGAIQSFCQNVILLENGTIKKIDTSKKAIDKYLFQNQIGVYECHDNYNREVTLIKAYAHDKQNKSKSVFDVGEDLGITFIYKVNSKNMKFIHGLNVYNLSGVNVLNSHDYTSKIVQNMIEPGEYQATVWFPKHFFNEDQYVFSVAAFLPSPFLAYFHEKDIISIKFEDKRTGDSARGYFQGDFPGVVRPLLEWQSEEV